MQKHMLSKYASFVTAKGNIVWAGALSLAWNQLRMSFCGNAQIRLVNEPEPVKQILDALNAKMFNAHDIDPNSYYVKSGYGQQTVDLINQEVTKKFPKNTMAQIDDKLHPSDIISYAYLYKALPFKFKFQRQGKRKFRDDNVDFFHTKQNEQKQQIYEYQWENKDNFTVKIDSRNQNQEIFIIKNQKKMMIDDAINHVIKLQSQKYVSHLRKIDYFAMPVIQLDAKRDIKELLGIPIANEQMKGYAFSKVFEALKLDIDQSGAKVENKAIIIATRCANFTKKQPKQYILDKPFWVVMKQKQKHPYLAVFINNPNDV